MRATISAVCLAALALTTATKVIELKDANFEHDTQATTGGTTGDWLVSFHTGIDFSRLDKKWQALSDKLNRRVSVASVEM